MASNAEPPLPDRLPAHVAIIMDGNGRWAKARGLPRLAGHKAGTENLRRIIRACVEFGVKYLTVYAFSTENWRRPDDEVKGLLNILNDVIDNEVDELDREGVQVRHVGRLEGLSPNTQKKISGAVAQTAHNSRLVLNVAFNYGGRDEVVYAIQRMIAEGVKAEDVNEALVSRYLFTAGVPDPDLIIRTSGELRVSNFLIWQGAYSELYVTPTYWPDFDREEFREALIHFGSRERRFGLTSTQVST